MSLESDTQRAAASLPLLYCLLALTKKGEVQVIALDRLGAFAKAVVGLAMAVSILGTAAICTLQGVVWVKTGIWSSLPFSQILELAGIEVGRTYITASSGSQTGSRLDFDRFIEWWLDAPAIIPMLVATALLALFYMWLKSREEALPRV